MAWSPSRSRERSATNSDSPPEAPVFFVERSLGARVVPAVLRARGVRVEVHADHFKHDEADAIWLSAVGRNGWVLLTKDKHIRLRTLEREALLRADVRAFSLTSGNLTGDEMAGVFLRHWTTIEWVARHEPAPFIAAVSKRDVLLYDPATRRWRPVERPET